jgi:hypothetical protein
VEEDRGVIPRSCEFCHAMSEGLSISNACSISRRWPLAFDVVVGIRLLHGAHAAADTVSHIRAGGNSDQRHSSNITLSH